MTKKLNEILLTFFRWVADYSHTLFLLAGMSLLIYAAFLFTFKTGIIIAGIALIVISLLNAPRKGGE
ncbi:hypothetical protein JKR26_01605 [Listeria monocytogenes]|nr:hypothetical protein [Listeria monocytogenes]MCP6813767.1 hypothetical protein [Listeria monocytogenes]MCP6825360.1 hypothetical protein [Listeria monocytogenes]MCP6904704.1 hypothetical protein [Listeria monocytogenes]MCP6916240.1 hypothetical protein [Listeria monocytogenes]